MSFCNISELTTQVQSLNGVFNSTQDLWKYEFISSVSQDISWVQAKWMSKISLSNKRNEFHISRNPYTHCSVYYIKTFTLLPHKNRAVNSNAFYDNRHNVRLSIFNKFNKTLHFISCVALYTTQLAQLFLVLIFFQKSLVYLVTLLTGLSRIGKRGQLSLKRCKILLSLVS